MASPGGGTHGVPPLHFVIVAIPLLLAAVFATQLPTIMAGQTVLWGVDWIPSLGIRLALYLDGLSLLFALMITGTGTLVLLYSGSYMAGDPNFWRFHMFLVAFMLSMLGVVLADDLITLFVFWELTSITSYLLIGFNHESTVSRRNALQALLVTGSGGLALLGGLVLMGVVVGDWQLSVVLTQGEFLREHPFYLGILILILLGAFTKSAQFPFHFWLPNAMAAPTPVSAYLHSATMVKAGVYLLARMHPALAGTPEWSWTLTIAGAITAVWASMMAVRQTDLKQALAHTTLMALGTLVMFLGSNTEAAITAAMTFLLVHALYKCALFLVVGIIDHETGTREVDRLGGLNKAMPWTAAAALAAGFAMAGFPPFLGFIGKELAYEAAVAVAVMPWFVTAAAVAANALMVVVAGLVAIKPFFGPLSRNLPQPKPHEAPWRMIAGPALLATMGLLFGLAPAGIGSGLLEPAVAGVLARPVPVSLSLWHGINVPLILSLITFGLGIVLFLGVVRLRNGLNALVAVLPNGDNSYDKTLVGLKSLAWWQTRVLQNGSLPVYLLTTFGVLGVAVGGTMLFKGGFTIPQNVLTPALHEWGLVVLIMIAVLVTVTAKSRLAAICSLGVIGVGVALLFLIFGAADVAMTQLMVETLLVIIVTVIFLKLPRVENVPPLTRRRGIVNAVISIGSGVVISALVLAVVAGDMNRYLSDFFERTAYPGGHGQNIVNVILVDFRAVDTLGEIVVVAMAGLAAFALIRSRRKNVGGE
ncbi:putative monovalent cation/H+ antiporter subunit A [Telmatospirillum sp. J64-1]|uniref:putative monovalent cation/H+ antiporter subunit A n=1 Tax=Telmatospirillum sp. J64-1 TaxID=2502183 RepID=UPI00115F2B68|nr:putative monovalent cation/H+ antiporter subunit A [Telmatospirillum sp. J64-1]